MAVRVKEVLVCIRKGLIFSVRTSCRSIRDHPFILVMVIFLLLLYRCFPSLFAFLISSSPVIVCTALLLGAILSYGEPNIPEIEGEDKKTSEISFSRAGSVADDAVVMKDEKASVANYVEHKRESNVTAKEVTLGEGSSSDSSKSENDVHDEEEKNDTLIASGSLLKEHQKQTLWEKQVARGREYHNQKVIEAREFSSDKLAEDISNQVIVGGLNNDWKELRGLKVEIDKPAVENHFVSSLGSPWEPIAKQDASADSESDRAESSSPDASMAEIVPMLDELHPLLDSKDPQPAFRSIDNSDAASTDSSQDHESENGSAVEEAENQDEEDDDEGPEEKDDGTEVVVKWTADDQKNLMDLGSSELERNQRLENLIAKRRARKNLKFEFERNLIDLDGNDSLSSFDQLYRLQVQIPSISGARRNPFDLPYDTEEADLPPIPGSAPSVLLPNRNPFDLPFDQADGSGTVTGEGSSQQEFSSVPQRDMFFRRHESFSVGASFPSEFRQERHEPLLKPYFETNRMDWKESHLDSYQRQLSERSDSKVSSVPETDSTASVAGQEDDKELIEQEFHQEIKMLSPAIHYVEPVELGSQSSDEAESLDSEQQRRDVTMVAHDSTNLNASNATGRSYQVPDAFDGVEESTRREDNNALISEKLEVIEEKFYDSSSSTSSETNQKSLNMNFGEKPATLDQADSGSSDDPAKFKLSIPADSPLLDRMTERVDDSQTAEPIYDSSPSAIEKSLSNAAALDEDLFYEGTGGSHSGSSFASETQAESSEFGMPAQLVQKSAYLEDRPFGFIDGGEREILNSGSGGLWVASSSLCSVEKNESRSKEISEIKEDDVIRIGFSGAGDDLSNPVATITPRTTAGRAMHHFSLPLKESESREETSVNVHGSLQPQGEEAITSAAYVDGLRLYNDMIPAASAKELESIIKPIPLGEQSQTSILNLPPIPEENLDDFILEEEHQSMTSPAPIGGFTGLQVIDKPNTDNTGLSDIGQELSFVQHYSIGEAGAEGDISKVLRKSGSGNFSTTSPTTHAFHGQIMGSHLVEPMERLESSSLSDAKDGGSPETSDDLKEESAEVKEFKGIDEGLLSELDAVGDFNVGNWQQDQSGSQAKLELDSQNDIHGAHSSMYTERHEIPVDLLASQARPIEYINLSLRRPSEVISTSSGHAQSIGAEIDPEQTVYNSKMHVLEACSHEEIDEVYKQLHDEAFVPSVREPTTGKHDLEPIEIHEAGGVPEPTEASPDLLVLEAKSIEDIGSAFKKFSQGGVDQFVCPEAGPSEILSGGSESMGTKSEIQVVEAKSLEDIHLALQQLSERTVGKVSEPVGQIEDSLEAEPVERRLSSEVSESSKTSSELLVLEATSIEDLNLAFQQRNQNGLEKSFSAKIGPSEILPADFHVETSVTHTDLEFVEAKSPAETHSSLKQISSSSIENPDITMASKAGFEANVRHLEPEVLEVQSAEEIELALEEAVAREAGFAADQNSNISNEAEKQVDVSMSGLSSSKEAEKKPKSVTS